MFKTSKKLIVVFIFLLSAILAGVFYFQKKLDRTPEAEPVFCNEYFENYQKLHKRIALTRSSSEVFEEKDVFSDAYFAWLLFSDSRYQEDCRAFKSGRNDDLLVYALGENLRLAREAGLENNSEDVFIYWDKADSDLLNLRKTEALVSFTVEMREIYPQLIALKESLNKEQGEIALENIKILFAALKRYAFGEDYHNSLLEMETEIAKLDKYFYGPDYLAAKVRLEEIFLEIYYRY